MTSYTTAINIISTFAILIVFSYHIGVVIKKIQINRVINDRAYPDSHDPERYVDVEPYLVASFILIITGMLTYIFGAPILGPVNNEGTMFERPVLSLPEFYIELFVQLGNWLPVEVGAVGLVGSLLYLVLRQEGFTI